MTSTDECWALDIPPQFIKFHPDRDELLKNIEELENGKKKMVEEQRKSDEKNTFLMKKIEGMCNCYHERTFFGYQRQDLKLYGVSMVCKTNNVVVKMKM